MNSNPADRHDLLGAYALDAVDDGERALVEELIARDPVARREADDLRDTASLLGLTAGAERTPPALWDRIVSAIDDGRERPATVASLDEARARRGSKWGKPAWIVGLAAALALVVGIGVGYTARNAPAGGLSAAYRTAAGRGEVLDLRDPATKQPMATVAWDAQAGAGFVRNRRMAALPAGQVYQLWVVPRGAGATPVSVGVLGGEPAAVSSFQWSGPMSAVAVSVERVPGAETPTRVVASTA